MAQSTPHPARDDESRGDTALGADGGVIARVAARTRMAGHLAVLGAVMVALGTWAWLSATGEVSAGLGLGRMSVGFALVAVFAAIATVLYRRARVWAAAGVALRAAELALWLPCSCSDPRPLTGTTLSGRSAVWRRTRRFPRQVLAIRAGTGPLAAGAAVTLHARRDGLVPAAQDRLRVMALGLRGPYLIERSEDQIVFVADRWAFSSP